MPESNVTITSELINTHVHNYSTEWNTDSTSHWHECACGDKVNVAAHVSNSGKAEPPMHFFKCVGGFFFDIVC